MFVGVTSFTACAGGVTEPDGVADAFGVADVIAVAEDTGVAETGVCVCVDVAVDGTAVANAVDEAIADADAVAVDVADADGEGVALTARGVDVGGFSVGVRVGDAAGLDAVGVTIRAVAAGWTGAMAGTGALGIAAVAWGTNPIPIATPAISSEAR